MYNYMYTCIHVYMYICIYVYNCIYVSETWPLLGTLKQHVQIKPLVGFSWIFPYIPPVGDFHPNTYPK